MTHEGRGIDTLVGIALAAVLVLVALFVGFLVWAFNHGAMATPRTVPVLLIAGVLVGGSTLAGVEGLLFRRGETGMLVRAVALGLCALSLGGFLLFVAAKLLTPGH